MTTNPVKARLNATVEKAVFLMTRRRVGSVVVVDSKDIPNGIITERELLRDISTNSRISSDKPLKEIMSLEFIRIGPLTAVEDAASKIANGGFRILVTRKNGELVGIVSTTDVLRFFNKTARDASIENVLSRKVVTIDSQRGLLDTIKIMDERRIGCVIVTEDGFPLGIVSERDLLKTLAKGRRKEFGSLRLRDLASMPLISAPYCIKAREASSLMLGSKIKRLPLFKGERIVGIVTAKDLIRSYSDSIQERNRKREVVSITRASWFR